MVRRPLPMRDARGRFIKAQRVVPQRDARGRFVKRETKPAKPAKPVKPKKPAKKKTQRKRAESQYLRDLTEELKRDESGQFQPWTPKQLTQKQRLAATQSPDPWARFETPEQLRARKPKKGKRSFGRPKPATRRALEKMSKAQLIEELDRANQEMMAIEAEDYPTALRTIADEIRRTGDSKRLKTYIRAVSIKFGMPLDVVLVHYNSPKFMTP